MKYNNIISVTALITSLMLSSTTAAENFYQCVPKKDWLQKIVRETVKNQSGS